MLIASPLIKAHVSGNAKTLFWCSIFQNVIYYGVVIPREIFHRPAGTTVSALIVQFTKEYSSAEILDFPVRMLTNYLVLLLIDDIRMGTFCGDNLADVIFGEVVRRMKRA